MAEILTLTTPISQATITSYSLVYLMFDLLGGVIEMTVQSNIGQTKTRRVVGQTAIDLMHTLNIANLSTKSLQRRVLEYMAAQGDFSGTISGTPN